LRNQPRAFFADDVLSEMKSAVVLGRPTPCSQNGVGSSVSALARETGSSPTRNQQEFRALRVNDAIHRTGRRGVVRGLGHRPHKSRRLKKGRCGGEVGPHHKQKSTSRRRRVLDFDPLYTRLGGDRDKIVGSSLSLRHTGYGVAPKPVLRRDRTSRGGRPRAPGRIRRRRAVIGGSK